MGRDIYGGELRRPVGDDAPAEEESIAASESDSDDATSEELAAEDTPPGPSSMQPDGPAVSLTGPDGGTAASGAYRPALALVEKAKAYGGKLKAYRS